MIPSGPPDVAEPVAVLVTLQLADELCPAGSQASDDGVNVFDGEGEMAPTSSIRWIVIARWQDGHPWPGAGRRDSVGCDGLP